MVIVPPENICRLIRPYKLIFLESPFRPLRLSHLLIVITALHDLHCTLDMD